MTVAIAITYRHYKETESLVRSLVYRHYKYIAITRKEDEPIESRLPAVYLKAKGPAFPSSRLPNDPSAERVMMLHRNTEVGNTPDNHLRL